jgi:epoxyqueuosine reductase QueG
MPHKTVAVNSGLGWIGKSALFITEEYGSVIRLTSVLTDAPLEYNKATIKSKCGGCMICTQACPGKAISGRAWSPELDRDEFFDAVACRKAAREIAAKSIQKKITLCGKCIEVCPYTRKYTRDALNVTND